MKSLSEHLFIRVNGKVYRPRIIVMAALIIVVCLTVTGPIQHCLDMFFIPFLLHHVRNKLLAAMIFAPIVFGGWYLIFTILLRWIDAKWGQRRVPRWLTRLTFVEVKPRK